MARKKTDTKPEIKSNALPPHGITTSRLYGKYARYQQDAHNKSPLSEKEFTSAFNALGFESGHIVKTDIELGYKLMKELYGPDRARSLNGRNPTFTEYANEIKQGYAEGASHLKSLLRKTKGQQSSLGE